MQHKFRSILTTLVIVLGAAMVPSGAHAQERTRLVNDMGIFKEFGEKAGLVAIMEDFMGNLLKDPRTKSSFENTDQTHVKAQLVEQFCFILNGPCEYKGAAMKPVHAGLDINREKFNALIEQLQFAMDKSKVPFRAQNKLLAVLAPMHRDIVTQ